MSRRPFPDDFYCYRDGRNVRIRELEAENAALKARIEILEPPKQVDALGLSATPAPWYPTIAPLRTRLKRRRP